MNILLTGGTGFIGGALIEMLTGRGDTVVVYTRSSAHFDRENIKYINSLDDITSNETFECFINLAGESMAQGRWTDERKAELVASRVETTRALVELARRLERPPQVVLSTSAIGYYGHQGDEQLAENAPPEDGFAQRLCQALEDEAAAFAELGARLCILRLGVVLAEQGGAMEELRKSVQFGVATWLGSGKQWLSWVHRDDVIRAMEFLLDGEDLSGAFNLTAPEPATNREFTEAMRAELDAWLSLPVPGMVMRIVLGEMAAELLLKGQRVIPRRLQEAGFEFRYNTLAEALPKLLAS